MERQSKIISFIGFALKARKIRCGVNAISTIKTKVKCLIVCKTASENTLNESMKLAKKLSSKLLISNIPVEQLVHKENCKLIAIEDNNLAEAILNNLDSHFSVYSGRLE